MLANQTFMVGERITYADITCALTLRSAYENVFTPEWRAPFPHVNRWFMTVVNQPGVKSVIGDVKLCVKEAQFDAKKFAEVSGKGKDNKKAAKKDQPKKEAAPKKEKKAAPAAEPEKPKEAKPTDPWGNCGKFTMDMDAWKRFFSNNPEEQSIEHFWTLITPEVKQNYSLWYADYSYADELTMDFMAANLVGGMFQRIEKLRKHAFASVIVGGTTRDLNITGLWFWRGDSLAFERSPDWQIDYEVYKWTKLDWDAPETKEMVYKYWKWDEAAKFGGKAFNEGKIYK
jgi:elongation factor 1-gamma